MGKKVLILFCEGFEEAEAIIPIDVFHRAGFAVTLSGVEELNVKSSHGITIAMDGLLSGVNPLDYDALVLPGGMKGSSGLSQSFAVNEAVIMFSANPDKVVAAICAAPAVVLGRAGVLEGHKATCYPSCETFAPDAAFSTDGVVVSGNIITAKSCGWAFDFALAITAKLAGDACAEKIRHQIYYQE